jgi:hypothetical protein
MTNLYEIPSSPAGWVPEDCRDWIADEWNSGGCDIIAIAISRLYGLSMAGEFERVITEDGDKVGFLLHAFCLLPDGRGIDASGIIPVPVDDPFYRDAFDLNVKGLIVLHFDERSSLLSNRDFEYSTDIDAMGAGQWVAAHLGDLFTNLGIEPIKLSSDMPILQQKTIMLAHYGTN